MLTEERLQELQELQKSNYSIMTEIEARMALDVIHSMEVQEYAWVKAFPEKAKDDS